MFSNELDEFNRLLNHYVRRDPVWEANRNCESAVNTINQWAGIEQAKLDAKKELLDQNLNAIREREEQIRSLQSFLNDRTAVPLAQYNAKVADYNNLVDDLRSVCDQYKADQTSFNQEVERFNNDFAQRAKSAERVQESAKQEIAEFKKWADNRGVELLFNEINRALAKQIEQARAGRHKSFDTRDLESLRTMRQEMSDHAIRRRETSTRDTLLVKAKLCDTEEGCFVVDTGAESVTVHRELVRMLDIEDRMGEEIQVVLPGGIRTKGRRIVIPRIAAGDAVAEEVEAIVLDSPESGVDGLLGLTFLNRFDFKIENGDSLRLHLLSDGGETGAANTKVYVSWQTDADTWWGHVVCDALQVMGYKLTQSPIFESGKSGPCILVTSHSELNRPDSRADWNQVIAMASLPKSSGKAVFVCCGKFPTVENRSLPANVPQVDISDLGWREKLRAYL